MEDDYDLHLLRRDAETRNARRAEALQDDKYDDRDMEDESEHD